MGQNTQFREKRNMLLIGLLGAVLSIGLVYLPILILLIPLMPLPYIWLLNKYGHRAGTVAVIITASINTGFYGIWGLVLTLVSFGLMAVVIGGAFREKLKPKWTAIITVAATMLSGLIIYYLAVKFWDYQALRQQVANSIPWDQLAKTGREVKDKREFVDSVMTLVPGVLASFAIYVGLVYYYLVAWFLRWRGFEVQRIKPIREWVFPRFLALVYIIFSFLSADPLTANLVLVLAAVLAVEGIAMLSYILSYMLRRAEVYPVVHLLMLLCVSLVFSFMLHFIGIVDNVFRIRVRDLVKDE